MNLYEIFTKLWEHDCATCPCEMGIYCAFSIDNELCSEDRDCIAAILASNNLNNSNG